jgi:multiple sugar transport system permease protein
MLPRSPTAARARARAVRRALLVLASLCVLAPFLFPFYWMAAGSLKSQVDFMAYPPVWSFRPTLESYHVVLADHAFGRYAVNSTIVAAAATGLGLVFGIPAAYAVARYRQTGLGLILLVTRLAPLVAFLIPFFVLFVRLHLIDTYTGLVATHVLVTLPVVVWMMIGFIEAVPHEIEQAAQVDGATVWTILWRITVPLAAPGIAAAAILAFIFSWNNFLLSVILSGAATRTLPAAIFNFLGYESINWGPLSAAATIITVPVLVLALVVQRYIVRGLVVGGLSA